jgi:hypothetical protein
MDQTEADVSPTDPTAAFSAAEPEPGRAVVPIPGVPRRQLPPGSPDRAGGSFWQRIALRGRQGLSKADRHEILMSRLSELERRLSESQSAIESRISELDQRLTQVWEVEEQLSFLLEIQQILTGLREHQRELGDRVRSNRRTLNLLVAALLATAVAITALALPGW